MKKRTNGTNGRGLEQRDPSLRDLENGFNKYLRCSDITRQVPWNKMLERYDGEIPSYFSKLGKYALEVMEDDSLLRILGLKVDDFNDSTVSRNFTAALAAAAADYYS